MGLSRMLGAVDSPDPVTRLNAALVEGPMSNTGGVMLTRLALRPVFLAGPLCLSLARCSQVRALAR